MNNCIGITGPIAPAHSNDRFPTHLQQFGAGGFRSVADTAERDAIPDDRLVSGMWVYDRSLGDTYVLEDDLTTWTLKQFGDGISYFVTVADNAARDALPAPSLFEGMWVYTRDSAKVWVLQGDLITWVEETLNPSFLVPVADNTARNAIPANYRVPGMWAYTIDTDKVWVLDGDLTTWVEKIINPVQDFVTVADNTARDAIPADRREEGMWAYTIDTDKVWVLQGDLTSWVEKVFGGGSGIEYFVSVADVAARDAIAGPDRYEGMWVYTVAEHTVWILLGDLTTWIEKPIGNFVAVADNTARDAIPAPVRVEGMWAYTYDTDKVWVLQGDFDTWVEKAFGTGIEYFVSVADNTARDAISMDDRYEGMWVYTFDTDKVWVLQNDLTTWVEKTFGASTPSYEIYYGGSLNPNLTGGLLALLTHVTQPYSDVYTYNLNVEYLYFALEATASPKAILISGVGLACAGSGDGYATDINGFTCNPVTISGVPCNVFRSKYHLDGTVKLYLI